MNAQWGTCEFSTLPLTTVHSHVLPFSLGDCQLGFFASQNTVIKLRRGVSSRFLAAALRHPFQNKFGCWFQPLACSSRGCGCHWWKLVGGAAVRRARLRCASGGLGVPAGQSCRHQFRVLVLYSSQHGIFCTCAECDGGTCHTHVEWAFPPKAASRSPCRHAVLLWVCICSSVSHLAAP